MKEKIFSKLKAAILINGKTDVSDETLNAFVDSISAQITDESNIDEAVKPYVAVFKSVQGNINAVAAASVKAEKEAKAALEQQIEELKKSVQKPDTDPDSGTLSLEDIKKLIEEATKADREKLLAFEAQNRQAVRKAEIDAKVKELGLTDADMKFVAVPEEKDVAEFLAEYRQNLIERGLKPIEASVTAVTDVKDAKERADEWLNRIEVKNN
jgi:hypothetical protein